MERINSPGELMEQLVSLNKKNPVCQVFIPSKGKFTIVLQEEVERTIADDVNANPNLKKLIQESIEAYQEDRFLTTSELIKSLSAKDFTK